MSAGAAIASARKALGLAPTVTAIVHRVVRLDRAAEGYDLVVFGDEDAALGVAAVADTGAVMSAARVFARRHLVINAVRAVQVAKLGEASAELVWKPCQVSRSALYPFWRVTGTGGTRFVDQQERCWDRLAEARA
jgi:hypothetical protein